MQTTSPRGIVALMLHEGIVPGPYLDSVGVWTYGVGHTAAAGDPVPERMTRGMPADLDRELRLVAAVFRADLAKYEAEVRRAIKVPLAQHEFDAAVSFHYNTGAIGRASWVKHLNAGDRAKAMVAIMAWKKPPEVEKRRIAERDLFQRGIYPTGTIPVWKVTDRGTVIWRPIRRLSPDAALAMLAEAGPEILPPPAPPAPPAREVPVAAGWDWSPLIAAILKAIPRAIRALLGRS